MIRIINLVGARPQFIKAAMISRELRTNYAHEVEEILVHSGQHYDFNLSGIFFEQLGLEEPKYHLGATSENSEEQEAVLTTALQNVIEQELPKVIVVYGDTTTTRVGAEVASKNNIPIAHIEAGLRSYNANMPEEINRVITDKLSTFLFVPTQPAIKNLALEGLNNSDLPKPGQPLIREVGDIMIDSLRVFGKKAVLLKEIEHKLDERPILLVTIHRNYNADEPRKLDELIKALEQQTHHYQVVFPVHPRTAKNLNVQDSPITFLPPISYLDMIALEQKATMILTDSGGVQKEAYYFEKPLIILRSETEWTELIDHKLAVLSGLSSKEIASSINYFKMNEYNAIPGIYGDGYAAERICKELVSQLK